MYPYGSSYAAFPSTTLRASRQSPFDNADKRLLLFPSTSQGKSSNGGNLRRFTLRPLDHCLLEQGTQEVSLGKS